VRGAEQESRNPDARNEVDLSQCSRSDLQSTRAITPIPEFSKTAHVVKASFQGLKHINSLEKEAGLRKETSILGETAASRIEFSKGSASGVQDLRERSLSECRDVSSAHRFTRTQQPSHLAALKRNKNGFNSTKGQLLSRSAVFAPRHSKQLAHNKYNSLNFSHFFPRGSI